MGRTIFFSWQSDLEKKTHRNLLENCIKKALKNLGKDDQSSIYIDYDRDTKNLLGSPDISNSIFEKIEKSVLFICDISIINKNQNGKKMPNPNVLIELGFAAKCLGWDRIICIFDANTGKIEDLPFDLRQKRILTYDSTNKDEKNKIIQILEENIKSLFIEGKLFNPLNDYMKARIDKALLDVCKQISNILFGTISLTEGLASVNKFLNLSQEEINCKLSSEEFHAYLFLNTYDTVNDELKQILNELLSSSYFQKEWSYIVLKFIDWLRSYNNLVSPRNINNVVQYICDENEYIAISGKDLNANNPTNSKVILKTFFKDNEKRLDMKGEVINITEYPDKMLKLTQKCKIKESAIKNVADVICKFQIFTNDWLDITDSEFILHPDYYLIY